MNWSERRSKSIEIRFPCLLLSAHRFQHTFRAGINNLSCIQFTLQGSNTYLLGTGRQRILIDSAQGFSEWKTNLQEAIKQSASSGGQVEITHCLLTHWHHDHICGLDDLQSLFPSLKIYKHLGSTYDPDKNLTNHKVNDISDGQKFSVPSGSDDGTDSPLEIQALYTPGHAKDHMCFVITSSPDPSEVGGIFTADNVLGHGTAVFEDLALYVQSLKLMRSKVESTVTTQKSTKSESSSKVPAFPGHGAVIADAHDKITEYISHRAMREIEALNVLTFGTTTSPLDSKFIASDTLTQTGALKTAEGFPQSQPPPPGTELILGKEWQSMDMVRVIYRHYPENLWGPAEFGLLQVLQKLKGEGKVEMLDYRDKSSEENPSGGDDEKQKQWPQPGSGYEPGPNEGSSAAKGIKWKVSDHIGHLAIVKMEEMQAVTGTGINIARRIGEGGGWTGKL